jgi:hypothetical protein
MAAAIKIANLIRLLSKLHCAAEGRPPLVMGEEAKPNFIRPVGPNYGCNVSDFVERDGGMVKYARIAAVAVAMARHTKGLCV